MPSAHSLEAKLQKHRSTTEILADTINKYAGSLTFLFLNIGLFVTWLIINLGAHPNIVPFDPYPFNLLTTVVSIEAILLAIFVLISQNRQSTINAIRDEIHLQIDLIAEREITKSLQLISDIHRQLIKSQKTDPELERMLKGVNTNYLEERMEKELDPQPANISDLLERLEHNLHILKKSS